MNRMFWVALGLALSLPTGIAAQNKSPKSWELSVLEERLVQAVKRDLPNSIDSSVEPAEGSQDVVIHKWTIGDKIVRIVIVRHASVDEAVRSIRRFAAEKKATSETPDGNDELYELRVLGSIALRKRQFAVYIEAKSTGVDDQRALMRRFAHLLSDAMEN